MGTADPSSPAARGVSSQENKSDKPDNKGRHSGHYREHDERQGSERALVIRSTPAGMKKHPHGKKEGAQGDRRRGVGCCSTR